MTGTSMDHPAKTDSPFDVFCDAFGDRESVRNEIEEFWRSGGSPFPEKVYAHLIQKRKTPGELTEPQAKFLIDYFNESFAPERTTGYADKHREPLVAAFAEAYANGGNRQIFRVEADIMNLGGLNKALEDAFKAKAKIEKVGGRLTSTELDQARKQARALADQVIRVMTGILWEDLKTLGDVQAIRHGGDEFRLYLKVNDADLDVTALNKRLLKRTQAAIAVFVADANLTDVFHLKAGVDAGVGVGCAAIKLEGQSQLKQHAALEAGIDEAKSQFREDSGPGMQRPQAATTDTSVPNVADLASTLNGHQVYKNYRVFDAIQPLLESNGGKGDTAQDARHDALTKHLERLGGGDALNLKLATLLDATHWLTSKLDPVTGLPLFKYAQNEILPHFCAKLPPENPHAYLVHVDFSNLGGGNKLGYWMGNAMRASFARCIEEALADNNLAHLPHSLMAQDGGRFALLLSPKASKIALETLPRAIKSQLQKHSIDKIELGVEEQQESIRRMQKASPNDPHVKAISDRGYFTVDDICNVKSLPLKGAHVETAMARFNTQNDKLGEVMHSLQSKVDARHKTREDVIKKNWREGLNSAGSSVAANR